MEEEEKEEEWEEEKEIQTDADVILKKIHACMHSIQHHANTIHYKKIKDFCFWGSKHFKISCFIYIIIMAQ